MTGENLISGPKSGLLEPRNVISSQTTACDGRGQKVIWEIPVGGLLGLESTN